MDCIEKRVDMRSMNLEVRARGQQDASILYQLNQADPGSEEYAALLKKLFGERLGEGSFIGPGLHGAAFFNVIIGNHVFINNNALFMARGGLTIEDHVQVAADVSFLTNNHDLYDRQVLLCKPVLICEGAWIGAHAIILPGVRVGAHAVVGAGAVVTKDVPDYWVAVGNPARVIRMLDPKKF